MRTRRPTSLALSLLAAPIAAVSLAACGGGGDGDADAGGVATLGPTTTVADAGDTAEEPPTGAAGATGSDAASSDPSSSDVPSSDPQQAMLDYAECMRDNGIDMPDPEFTDDGGMMITAGVAGAQGDGPDPEEFEAADEECGHLMEGARNNIEIDPEEQAEMQEQMLEFAECMREQGIDMPDPQFDDEGRVTMQMGEEGEAPSQADNDEFIAANAVCGQEGGMAPAIAIEAED